MILFIFVFYISEPKYKLANFFYETLDVPKRKKKQIYLHFSYKEIKA